MWHRVAALLGRRVPELQREMSSAEFVDWCAFYQLEPWGFEAANWRMGVLASTVANYSGRVKKPVKPSDFFPRAPGSPKRLTQAELQARLMADIEKAKSDG